MILVGPSGSGKSTALRIVAGLEDATDGEVRIGDDLVNDVEPRDRDVAMVFQSYALYPHKTVEANMGFALKMQRVPKAVRSERVHEVARLLGIEELLHRRPRQLSGGQRQRVALGRAIVRRPRAFLMDEPLSNLDAKLRVEMRTYIGQLHQELGVTTVYVTHDQVEAMTMGDRVAVMRDGKIVQVDTPQELYDRPADLFVAGFMGSPAMNLVQARVEKGGVVFGSQRIELPNPPPALASYEGREVVLGIRPEAVEVSLNGSSAGREFTLPVVLTEALGSDLLVHLDVDAPAVVTADMLSAAEEMTEAEVQSTSTVARGHARMTARLAPSVVARPGESIKLKVEPERLHFFDPGDGSGDRVSGERRTVSSGGRAVVPLAAQPGAQHLPLLIHLPPTGASRQGERCSVFGRPSSPSSRSRSRRAPHTQVRFRASAAARVPARTSSTPRRRPRRSSRTPASGRPPRSSSPAPRPTAAASSSTRTTSSTTTARPGPADDPNDPFNQVENMFAAKHGTLTYPTDTATFANNAADLVELRVKPTPTATAFRVTLNTLKAPDRTAIRRSRSATRRRRCRGRTARASSRRRSSSSPSTAAAPS